MFDKQSLERQMKRASGQSGRLASWRAALMAVTVLTAAGFVLAGGTWLGPHGDSAMAREFKDQPGRTQSGARVDFSSLKDWNLKAENMVPSGGYNPLYFPLKPGFRYIMEHPNHPHGLISDRSPWFSTRPNHLMFRVLASSNVASSRKRNSTTAYWTSGRKTGSAWIRQQTLCTRSAK